MEDYISVPKKTIYLICLRLPKQTLDYTITGAGFVQDLMALSTPAKAHLERVQNATICFNGTGIRNNTSTLANHVFSVALSCV